MNRLVTALGAVALTLPLLGLPSAVSASSLPDPGRSGSLTVERQDTAGDPVTDPVDVTVCLIRYDAAGNAIDLTTNLGWQRAAHVTVYDAPLLADPADCLTQLGVAGIATFSNLPLGLWHVSLTYPGGEEASEPFLTPLPRIDEDGQTWIYDVHAFPKPFDPDPVPNRAAIGGTVWRDYNLDGVIDAGESRVPNVTVSVYRLGPAPLTAPTALVAPGTYLGSTLTAADGTWFMGNLPAGQKVVRFNVSTANSLEHFYTFTNVGPDFQGADPATGLTDAVTVVYDEIRQVNLGLVRNEVEQQPPATPSPSPTPPPGEATPGPTQPPRQNLPVTGGQIAGLLGGAAALTGLGIFFLISRKRKETANA